MTTFLFQEVTEMHFLYVRQSELEVLAVPSVSDPEGQSEQEVASLMASLYLPCKHAVHLVSDSL